MRKINLIVLSMAIIAAASCRSGNEVTAVVPAQDVTEVVAEEVVNEQDQVAVEPTEEELAAAEAERIARARRAAAQRAKQIGATAAEAEAIAQDAEAAAKAAAQNAELAAKYAAALGCCEKCAAEAQTAADAATLAGEEATKAAAGVEACAKAKSVKVAQNAKADVIAACDAAKAQAQIAEEAAAKLAAAVKAAAEAAAVKADNAAAAAKADADAAVAAATAARAQADEAAAKGFVNAAEIEAAAKAAEAAAAEAIDAAKAAEATAAKAHEAAANEDVLAAKEAADAAAAEAEAQAAKAAAAREAAEAAAAQADAAYQVEAERLAKIAARISNGTKPLYLQLQGGVNYLASEGARVPAFGNKGFVGGEAAIVLGGELTPVFGLRGGLGYGFNRTRDLTDTQSITPLGFHDVEAFMGVTIDWLDLNKNRQNYKWDFYAFADLLYLLTLPRPAFVDPLSPDMTHNGGLRLGLHVGRQLTERFALGLDGTVMWTTDQFNGFKGGQVKADGRGAISVTATWTLGKKK